jgi:hypothetical protein
MNFKILIGLLFLNVLLSACHDMNAVEKFGLDFNIKRKQIGLPLLDSSWKVVKNSENIIMWLTPQKKDSLVYLSKLIQLENGVISREENRIIGRQKYNTVDGNFFEDLYISCYLNDSLSIKSWNCEYNGLNYEFGKKISKQEADSIMQKWFH